MKGHSVPGSGKKGQPKSTLNIHFFIGFVFIFFIHVEGEYVFFFFMSLPY